MISDFSNDGLNTGKSFRVKIPSREKSPAYQERSVIWNTDGSQSAIVPVYMDRQRKLKYRNAEVITRRSRRELQDISNLPIIAYSQIQDPSEGLLTQFE